MYVRENAAVKANQTLLHTPVNEELLNLAFQERFLLRQQDIGYMN